MPYGNEDCRRQRTWYKTACLESWPFRSKELSFGRLHIVARRNVAEYSHKRKAALNGDVVWNSQCCRIADRQNEHDPYCAVKFS